MPPYAGGFMMEKRPFLSVKTKPMHYLFITAVAAFLSSFPQVANEQVPVEQPVVIQESPIPEILLKIADCESRGKHFDENGDIITGQNKHDVGKYQINVYYWKKFAEERGHDIYSEGGNEAVALELYERYGTAPWKWSKKCWSK